MSKDLEKIVSDTEEFQIISHGNLLFRGCNDKKLLEQSIVTPLLRPISKQIIKFCTTLTSDEFYCLSWRIHKGKPF